jgi:dynein heavy chain
MLTLIFQMSAKVQYYTKIVFGLERSLATNSVVPKLKSMVESFKVFISSIHFAVICLYCNSFVYSCRNFKMVLPIVLDLRNPGLKQRHWDRIQEVLGVKNIRDKSFTLGMLLNLNVIGGNLFSIPFPFLF